MLLLVYLYVLWGLVRAIWFSFVPWPLGELDPWMQLLVSPIQPWSGLWYLYALALYMALAWVIRSLPAWSQLSAGAVVSALFASGFIQLGVGYTWRSIGTYFFFFLLGIHARGLILRFAERVTWLTGLGTLLGYGAARRRASSSFRSRCDGSRPCRSRCSASRQGSLWRLCSRSPASSAGDSAQSACGLSPCT